MKKTVLFISLLLFILKTNSNAQNSNTLTDSRDGKTYKIIKIGNQTWMAENLNFTTDKGCCCYYDSTSLCDKYGRLYDWETASKACPIGWHLPSKSEFDILIKTVEKIDTSVYISFLQGGSSGFNALLGGYKSTYSIFSYITYNGNWWTSTINSTNKYRAWYFTLNGYSNIYDTNDEIIDAMFSVRCIKNK